MADIKNSWNKYRNSRADIKILQIAWSASQNCILTLLGGGGMQLIERALQDSQETRRLETWLSAFCIKYMYQIICFVKKIKKINKLIKLKNMRCAFLLHKHIEIIFF